MKAQIQFVSLQEGLETELVFRIIPEEGNGVYKTSEWTLRVSLSMLGLPTSHQIPERVDENLSDIIFTAKELIRDVMGIVDNQTLTHSNKMI